MASYIYKITSPSNKIYIGQTRNLKKRKSCYKNIKCTGQPKLHASLQKYGWENHMFNILHELPDDISQCILNTYEIIYMTIYKEFFTLLNIKEGGSNGKHSIETKNIIRDKKLNKKQTEETILKRLETFRKNEYIPSPPSNLGKKASDATKQKQREKKLGKLHTEQSKLKCMLNARTSVLLLDENTGIYYDNITELSKLYGIPRTNMIRFLRKTMKDNNKSKTVPNFLNSIKIV